MVNSLGSLLLLSLLLEICTLSIIATNSCQGSCDPGQQPSEYCTKPLLCNTCPQGTFSDRNLRFGEKCNTRKTCLEDHMVTIDEGDETHDATCGCKEGYEMSNSVHACYKKSVAEPTTYLAVYTDTTDQVPVPSTTKTGLYLAIVLPVSILALILIFGLLFVYKSDKFGLKGNLQTICCDRNGLQGDNHVVYETSKHVRELPEEQPLNDGISNGHPESDGSHEYNCPVREGGEQNSSASKSEQALLLASEQPENGASSAHLSPSITAPPARSLPPSQLTPPEAVSTTSTTPHLPSSSSYTKSHKENSTKVLLRQPVLLEQHPLPSQQQPIKANDTEPPPEPLVKSEIQKQPHSAISTGSLPPSQLTRLEIGSRTSTTPHLQSNKSITRSDKENSPKIALEQYPLPTQRQPVEANDTEPPPLPPLKSEIPEQSRCVLPTDLHGFFMDNLITFNKHLHMDSTFLTHLFSNKVIASSMLEVFRESNLPNNDKILNLMTNYLPKRSRQSNILFLKCLIETEQGHILSEIGLTEEQVEYIGKYEKARRPTIIS